MLPARKSRLPWLLGLLCGILTGGLAIVIGLRFQRRRDAGSRFGMTKEAADRQTPAPTGESPDLMTRITSLMEEQQIFRRKGLTLRDVAQALGTNTHYVSACINTLTSGSYTDFVNGYRIRYAQSLLRAQPDALLSDVGEQSGFSSNASFFRNFKAVTGKTPAQWLAEQ